MIELLVVIAIIAILASMLLPALQKARDRAAAVKCQGNMKTFGSAITLYLSDNKEQYPGYWNGGDYNSSTANWCNSVPITGSETKGTAGVYAAYLGLNSKGTIFGVLQSGPVYVCRLACPKLVREPIPGNTYRTGIAMTQDTDQQSLYKGKVKHSLIRRPSKYVPYVESESTTPSNLAQWNKEATSGMWMDKAVAYRHGAGPNAGATMVFADAHVELRPKFKVPGKWSIGDIAYYCSFYNPWPVAGYEDRFDKWN